MTLPSLGWQSWSPPIPNFLRFPPRDYCPVKETPHSANIRLSHKPTFNYWCSWYALGWQINPHNLLIQAKFIKQHQLNITHFLIDDGWRFSWLKPLIQELHSLGFRVGLWYSPYTRHKHLPLYTTLDSIVNYYQIDFLKLDFLYKPYFQSGLNSDLLPHQALVDLFTFLHHNHPQLFTITCGCPFAPALGLVDAIRISKDTTFPPPTPTWLRRPIYSHRVSLLRQKYEQVPASFPALPDLDVRLFSLDNQQTTTFWDTIHHALQGIGDDLTKLSPSQTQKVRLWLT
jgi:hypothetical protein